LNHHISDSLYVKVNAKHRSSPVLFWETKSDLKVKVISMYLCLGVLYTEVMDQTSEKTTSHLEYDIWKRLACSSFTSASVQKPTFVHAIYISCSAFFGSHFKKTSTWKYYLSMENRRHWCLPQKKCQMVIPFKLYTPLIIEAWIKNWSASLSQIKCTLSLLRGILNQNIIKSGNK